MTCGSFAKPASWRRQQSSQLEETANQPAGGNNTSEQNGQPASSRRQISSPRNTAAFGNQTRANPSSVAGNAFPKNEKVFPLRQGPKTIIISNLGNSKQSNRDLCNIRPIVIYGSLLYVARARCLQCSAKSTFLTSNWQAKVCPPWFAGKQRSQALSLLLSHGEHLQVIGQSLIRLIKNNYAAENLNWCGWFPNGTHAKPRLRSMQKP